MKTFTGALADHAISLTDIGAANITMRQK